jgi:dTDP-4-dehydrorhamnose reductase
MAKILVTGSKGQLGSELRDILINDKSHTIFLTDQEDLDITNRSAVNGFIEENGVEIIINCAAYTAVDNAEDNALLCEKVNRDAPAILASAAKKADALLIHISTDYVFNGLGPLPYREDMRPDPCGVYGRTKAEGEFEVTQSGARHIIIRTSWLYSTYGNNFVKTILRLAKERDSLNVVFDQIGTPTYAANLAKTIMLSTTLPNGIYHYSDEGVCSWYDFAVEIVKLSGSSCKVSPVTSENFPTKAKRPPYSVMDKGKIRKALAIEIPHWRDSLNLFYSKLTEL